MNVGIVTTWFERGASYVSKQYMKIFEKEGYKVFIFARGGEKYAKKNPSWDFNNVYWSKRIPIAISTYFDLKEFEKWIDNNKIDIIFFNEQKWYPPVQLANKKGIKTVAYIDYYTEETIPLFENYDMLVCNTKKHYTAFKWHLNAVYIPWGTDVNLFKPRKLNDKPKKEKVTFFHSCGYAPERKGTKHIIKALKFLRGNFKVIIHTQINLKKLFPDLVEIIETYENNGKLEIIEKTVPAPGLYYLGDVYVYPSELDGIGLSLIEAISSGLAIITTNNGPMNEFVDKSFSKLIEIDTYISRSDGYYWPKSIINFESLINNMQYFIDNQDKINLYKTNARNYAEKNLNWESNAKKLGKLMKKLEININKYKIKKETDNYTKKIIRSNCLNILYFKAKPIYYSLRILKKIAGDKNGK